jgi:hypothetical protein
VTSPCGTNEGQRIRGHEADGNVRRFRLSEQGVGSVVHGEWSNYRDIANEG